MSDQIEPLTADALEQVRGMLTVPVSIEENGKNVVLLMGTARKLLATLDADRAAAPSDGLREALDAALIGMVRTSWPMHRNAEEKGWNEAVHEARKRVSATLTEGGKHP